MDIDDLLEDSEPTGQPKKDNKGKASWTSIAQNKLNPSADDDDDIFDDSDLFNWGVNAKKKPTTAPAPAPKVQPKKAEDDDEWGIPTTTA
jgi:hypothetical protein